MNVERWTMLITTVPLPQHPAPPLPTPSRHILSTSPDYSTRVSSGASAESCDGEGPGAARQQGTGGLSYDRCPHQAGETQSLSEDHPPDHAAARSNNVPKQTRDPAL